MREAAFAAIRLARLLLVSSLVLTLVLAGTVATAKEKKDRESRKQYTLGQSMAKKLNTVIESLNAEQYDQARELLEPLSQKTSLNPYERALVYQTGGQSHGCYENTNQIKTYGLVTLFWLSHSIAHRSEEQGAAPDRFSAALQSGR